MLVVLFDIAIAVGILGGTAFSFKKATEQRVGKPQESEKEKALRKIQSRIAEELAYAEFMTHVEAMPQDKRDAFVKLMVKAKEGREQEEELCGVRGRTQKGNDSNEDRMESRDRNTGNR